MKGRSRTMKKGKKKKKAAFFFGFFCTVVLSFYVVCSFGLGWDGKGRKALRERDRKV